MIGCFSHAMLSVHRSSAKNRARRGSMSSLYRTLTTFIAKGENG